ncbi:MAG TPA: DNA repair protein RadC [Phycisphaerales bacterium]|nr:DNA repair protein RadC [Phycisphaerales bacterium]
MYRLTSGLPSNPSKRDLPKEPGPREKLLAHGVQSLTEVELLSLVLGRGGPGTPVTQLAEELNALLFLDDGGTRKLALEDCLAIKGLGAAKASAILAGIELGRRTRTVRGRPIHAPEDALPHLHWLVDCSREHFVALYLDTRRRLIKTQTVSVGTLEASLVHPREVFRPALQLGASAILVAHNHPSGDPEPSPEDIALTARLDKAGKLLGIQVLDHLVLGGSDWVSLRQRQIEGGVGVAMFAA